MSTAVTLTETERQWCLALRSALKDAKVAAPASDFELALFAIVAKGDCEKGVARVTRYNHIMAKYKLDSTSSLGVQSAKWADETLPGYAHGGGSDVHDRPVFFLVAAAMKPGAMAGLSQYAMLCTDAVNAVTCDLDCARRGYTVIYDCKGVRPSNLSMAVSRMEFDLFLGAFPCKPKLFIMLDAPLIVRSFVKLIRPLMPTKLASRIQFLSSAELSTAVKPENLPLAFGGAFSCTTADWLQSRLTTRNQVTEAVSIGDPVHVTDRL